MMDPIDLRVPPHSIEAESSVLGGLLLDNAAWDRVGDLLTDSDFYRNEHRLAFAAIAALCNAGKPADVVTVFEHLQQQGKADQVGGLAYLNSLAQYVPSAGNIRRYAEIVRERSILRGLVTASDEIAASAFNPQGRPVVELIDAAATTIAKLSLVDRRRDSQLIQDSIAGYLDLLTAISEGRNPAIPIGLVGLDRPLNGGLRRGELMVVGARPKHGKTALALAMARNMAHRFSVLYLSQEMAVEAQIMHRHVAAMGNIELSRLLAADARDEDMWHRVADAVERMRALRLAHDDQAQLTLSQVRRKAIKHQRAHGLDVLIIDFLQLMRGAGDSENRNRELDVIANGLKALAMDLNIAVIVLSQLSRKADEHLGRPTMTHLRDSGAIEAAADQVALLFTEHAHPLSRREPAFADFAELEIVANRSGPRAVVPLLMKGSMQQVADWIGPVPIAERRRASSDI